MQPGVCFQDRMVLDLLVSYLTAHPAGIEPSIFFAIPVHLNIYPCLLLLATYVAQWREHYTGITLKQPITLRGVILESLPLTIVMVNGFV